MKKILWVKSDFLHPTNRGGQIRSLEIVRRLHRRHQVHYVAFEDPTSPGGLARSTEGHGAVHARDDREGREVRVYAPLRTDAIYDSNRNFILNAIPHVGRLLDDELDTLLTWAEYLVIAQNQDGALAKWVIEGGLPVLDLVGSQFSRSLPPAATGKL